MPVTLTSTGIRYNDNTNTNTLPIQTPEKFIQTSTSSDRTLSGDSGWVTHLQLTFTTTRVDVIRFLAQFSASYESGNIDPYARILLSDGQTSPENLKIALQFNGNKAVAGHAMEWSVQKAAGTYTASLQVRNFAGGTTWIANYWGGNDTFGARYF